MWEKLGEEPQSDKEIIQFMSGLASTPAAQMTQEKDIKDLSKE